MDATTERLARYVLDADCSRLSSQSVHECKRRLIDTLGCALGAYDEPLSVKARALALRASGDPAARIWGSRGSPTPEMAAFTNGVMGTSAASSCPGKTSPAAAAARTRTTS